MWFDFFLHNVMHTFPERDSDLFAGVFSRIRYVLKSRIRFVILVEKVAKTITISSTCFIKVLGILSVLGFCHHNEILLST